MNITDRTAALFARQEELDLKAKGQPYSEAVILTCDWFLAMPQDNKPQYIVRSQPDDRL